MPSGSRHIGAMLGPSLALERLAGPLESAGVRDARYGMNVGNRLNQRKHTASQPGRLWRRPFSPPAYLSITDKSHQRTCSCPSSACPGNLRTRAVLARLSKCKKQAMLSGKLAYPPYYTPLSLGRALVPPVILQVYRDLAAATNLPEQHTLSCWGAAIPVLLWTRFHEIAKGQEKHSKEAWRTP
jgi:hypothetical protein